MLPTWLSKLQYTYLWKVLEKNIFFWNWCANFFGLWGEKNRAFSQKFSSGSIQQKFALPKKCFREKWFLFRKSFIFLLSFFEFEWFLCRFAKCFSQVCQATDQRAERTKLGKLTFEIFVFFQKQFCVLSRKTWIFSKTVRVDSQYRSLHVQMNIFKRFCGSKNNCMKVSGHRTETPDFRWKCFLGVFEGDFKCPVQHFDKKLIRVSFTFYGLFRTLCVFFCSERKDSQGFQNHNLGVQMKKLGRIFLTQRLSENIFNFWAEELGVLAKNYRHGCQNYNLRTFKKFWGKTFNIEYDFKLLRILK